LAGVELLPAAAIVEMVVAAARQLAPREAMASEAIVIDELAFDELPLMAADQHLQLQLVCSDLGAAGQRFHVAQAIASDAAPETSDWRMLARGVIVAAPSSTQRVVAAIRSAPEEAAWQPIDAYALLADRLLHCAPALRSIRAARGCGRELDVDVAAARDAQASAGLSIEPSTLDACFQALACSAANGDSRNLSRVRSIRRLVVCGPLSEHMTCRVRDSVEATAEAVSLTLELCDAAGAPRVIAEGVVMEELGDAQLQAVRERCPAAADAEAMEVDLLATLRGLEPEARAQRMREHVRREVARVVGARSEDLADDLAFRQQGLDSIMGLELRNRFESTFGVELPASLVYTHQDISALARFLLEVTGLQAPAESAAKTAAISAGVDAGPWVLRPVPRSKDAMRLLVFPFSGGTAGSFVQWANRLPDEIELCAIELPGHGFHARAPAYEDFFALLAALDEQLAGERSQPYGLFGHSMGAMVAFELARRWSQDGGRAPSRLFVSGLPAPQWFSTESLRDAVAQNRLMDHLEKWGAVAPNARDGELLALGMPALRADLTALASWSYRAAAPLSCPITALRATDDSLTPQARTEAWRDQTRGSFRSVTFPGDHFYLLSERARLLRVIVDDLLGHAEPGELQLQAAEEA
jgi:surfactin synthase thioesterase subunit/acyl carrier protein